MRSCVHKARRANEGYAATENGANEARFQNLRANKGYAAVESRFSWRGRRGNRCIGRSLSSNDADGHIL
jgi:hypothetical protein